MISEVTLLKVNPFTPPHSKGQSSLNNLSSISTEERDKPIPHFSGRILDRGQAEGELMLVSPAITDLCGTAIQTNC